uniref:Uncharacterized protein n=1 Tax=Arundo donax TaxID=35708 RepID=A0A0A8Y438_ARUDO
MIQEKYLSDNSILWSSDYALVTMIMRASPHTIRMRTTVALLHTHARCL